MNEPIYEISRMYNYVRSRQLEGTFNGDASIGNWPITIERIMKGWGNPPELTWPYNGNADDWPPMEEPPSIDEIAKRNRIGVYQRIRTIAEAKLLLNQRASFIGSFPIYDNWFRAKDGVISMPDSSDVQKGKHVVAIIGYDDDKSILKFANSWSSGWGDHGFGYLPYAYFEKYFIEGWAIADYRSDLKPSSNKGVSVYNYGIPDLLGGTIHVIEIFDSSKNEFLAWSFSVLRNGYLDVEEFFVHPDFRHREHGKTISKELLELSRRLELPLRVWISEADSGRDNLDVIDKILAKMNLNRLPGLVSWAAYTGIKGLLESSD